VGATGLLTTVEDLAKWTMNFEKPVVGDADIIRRFDEPSLFNDKKPVVYSVVDRETIYHAKGQMVRNYRGVDLYNHTGHDAGFRAYLVRFPKERLSIITLSNDESNENFKNGMTIAEFYLKDKLKERAATAAPTASEKKIPFSQTVAGLREYEGIYESAELATAYTLRVKSGKLLMTHSRLSDAELTVNSKDKFSGRITFPVEVEFVRNEKGAVVGFAISNFGAKNMKFEKTAPLDIEN
jgi:hypothetical protein